MLPTSAKNDLSAPPCVRVQSPPLRSPHTCCGPRDPHAGGICRAKTRVWAVAGVGAYS